MEDGKLCGTRNRYLSESDLFQISMYSKLVERIANPIEALADIINDKVRELQVALYSGNDTDIINCCANVEAVCGEMRRRLTVTIDVKGL